MNARFVHRPGPPLHFQTGGVPHVEHDHTNRKEKPNLLRPSERMTEIMDWGQSAALRRVKPPVPFYCFSTVRRFLLPFSPPRETRHVGELTGGAGDPMTTHTGPCGDTLAWKAYREKPKATRIEKPVDGRTTPTGAGREHRIRGGTRIRRMELWRGKVATVSNEHKVFCLFQQRRTARRADACASPSSRCDVC